MNCAECGGKTAVFDSRPPRRKRECLDCGYRFATWESFEKELSRATKKRVAAKPKAEPKPKKVKPVVLQTYAPEPEYRPPARLRIEELQDEREARADWFG